MTSEPLTVTIARPLYEPVVVPGVDPHGGTEIVSARAIEAASAVAMAITIERARTDRNPLDAMGRDYPPVAVGKARKRGLARPPQPRPWGRASVPSARTMGLPWGSTREIPLTCRSSSRNLPRHKQMEILAWVRATGGRASRRPRRPLSRALLSEIVAPPFDPELEDDATAHAGSRSIICKFV